MTKKKKQAEGQPQVGSTAGLGGELRKALIHRQHGTPLEQKDALVNDILETCCDPSKWPLTDLERIECLRLWYRKAMRIRNTPT